MARDPTPEGLPVPQAPLSLVGWQSNDQQAALSPGDWARRQEAKPGISLWAVTSPPSLSQWQQQ